MPDIGVRELKARASEIIRNVREHRTRYTITYRGQPVGVLAPLEQSRTGPLDHSEETGVSASGTQNLPAWPQPAFAVLPWQEEQRWN